ncbi:hypothetical protein E3P99_00035 [Wallemia hederae]|uniref:Uncharacterized protein n=1 Tax=Wallemia hederae TaxID=1540922 RepID=A0A4T0G2G5_9BASI|nr:hypothetical protein E3P99_00035 [Wallemia hederae]
MPRVPHKSHSVGFPIYSLAFISPSRVVLGGGGGSSSKTGVKNKLAVYDISSDDITPASTYELDSADDCPMSLSVPLTNKHHLVAGINTSTPPNTNLRLFNIDGDKLSLESKTQTIYSDDVEAYQRIAEISPSPTHPIVVVDGKRKEKQESSFLHTLSFPQLKQLNEPLQIQGDILSANFSADGALLAVATSKQVTVYAVESDEKKTVLKEVQSISEPLIRKNPGGSLRYAKFGRGSHTSKLYTITNSAPPAKKRGARPGFLTAWDTNSWTVIRSVRLADKPVTACDLSEDGQLIAFASADLSVGIVSAKTLAPLVRILSAHSFPVTCLSFDPTATVLASGSPDNSMRLVQVPPDLAAGDSARAFVQALVIAILIGLLAVLLQLYQRK